MFHDLDDTLRALLHDPDAPAELREAEVSVTTPDKDFRPPQATVDLFLHEVQENRTLRDPEPILVRTDGHVTRRLPPLRVDCSYLVTTWSALDAALGTAEEHRLLGQVLAWLARFGTLPERCWRGGLVGQPYPPPAMVAQLDGRQNTSEFWTALGIAPRPAFTLTVTVALELGAAQPEGPQVETTVLRITAPPGEDDRRG